MRALMELVKRNMRLYLRDKVSVFLSMLAPIIVLGLYLLFLRNIQQDNIKAVLDGTGLPYADKDANFLIDGWMICSVIASALVTVPLGVLQCVVSDKINRIDIDFSVTPIEKWKPPLAYFISVVTVSFVIVIAVLLAGMVYLAIAYGQTFAILSILAGSGIMLLGCLSSTALILFLAGLIKTENAFSVLSVIFGTAVGFLIGAYMPLVFFPNAIQTFSALLPATHITALLKDVLLSTAVERLAGIGGSEAVGAIAEGYGLKLFFAGRAMPKWGNYLTVVVYLVIFLVIDVLFYLKKRR